MMMLFDGQPAPQLGAQELGPSTEDGLFVMWYRVACNCGWRGEIEKSMQAEYPSCPICGSRTGRVWDVPIVHYAAPGFSVHGKQFAEMVGPDRAAKFEAQKADAMRRQAQGKLTPYEKSLEKPHALEG